MSAVTIKTIEALSERERAAIRRALEMRGFEIIEEDFRYGDSRRMHFIASDEGTVVFIKCRLHIGKFWSNPDGKADFELAAAEWFESHSYSEFTALRYDEVDLLVSGDGKGALVRHHIDALNRKSCETEDSRECECVSEV